VNTENQDRNLFIILASGDPDAALNMAFMYAGNSLRKGWWDTVRLIVWGPSAKTVAQDQRVKAALPDLVSAGVELWACKRCADEYGVSGTLEKLGLDVFHVGEATSEMLQSGWKSLTV
jgi:hypothetical protein